MMEMIYVLIFLIVLIYTNEYEYNGNCSGKKDIIQTLLRQSARWSVAAENDRDSMIAVLHANYGAAYLWALLDIATTKEIEDVSGIDILKFKRKVQEVQDDATMRMAGLCPAYAPPPSILTKVSGEGF